MSAFNPETFLDAVQTEVNERRIPLPVDNPSSPDGTYLAVIGEIKTETGTIGKGENIGKPWLSMIIPLKLELSQQVQDYVKYGPNFTLTDRVFLDLTADGTGLDNTPGKNRGQKMYRDALGMNAPGVPFSWRKVTGQVVKVKITHEMYNGFPNEKVATLLKA